MVVVINKTERLARALFGKALQLCPNKDPEIDQIRWWDALPLESKKYWISIASTAIAEMTI